MAEDTSKAMPEDASEPNMQMIMLVADIEALAERGETSTQDRLLDSRLTFAISEEASKLGLSIYFVSN